MKKILATIVLVVFILPVRADQHSLPTIGGLDFISERDQYILGRNWLYEARNTLPIIINSPQLQEYMEHLVYEIGSYSSLKNTEYEVVIIRDEEINAFAVTSGVMGFYLGLILAVESEDELASVIAHEIGHLGQKHYLELLYASKAQKNISLGSLLAGLGMIFTGLPSAAFVTILGSAAFNTEKYLDLVRLNEEEADDYAVDVLNKSGRSPEAMVSMLERLYSKYGEGDTPLLFRTHPLTESRISYTRSRVQNIGGYRGFKDQSSENLAFFTAQVLAQIHLSRDYKKLVEKFEYEVQTERIQTKKDALQYGLAFVSLLENKPESTLQLLDSLIKKYPLNIYFQGMSAQAQFMLGNKNEAEQKILDLLQFNPDNIVLTTYLSDMYIRQNKLHEAQKILEAQSELRPNDVWIWSKLNSVYGSLGMTSKSHYTRAEILFLLGGYSVAKEQLRYAKEKTQDKNFQIRLEQRLQEMERWTERLTSLQ